MNFKKEELKKFRKFKGPLIDVRSPNEYYKGHMPNSFNIPLFDNEERSIVGKIYKNNGREKAVIQGLVIIEKKIDKLVSNIFNILNTYRMENDNCNERDINLKIYCARGGMRSKSVAWLMHQYKNNTIRLIGGYKSYRRWTLNTFNKEFKIVVIGGKTGTGKTKLLKLLRENNYQVIDLEGLASHRGSTFGGLGMREQPSNEQFENMIAENLNLFKTNNIILVEAESANIGKCKVPNEFFRQMKTSPRVEIVKSDSNRLEELIKTYSIYKQDELQECVLRIKKRLGPQRTKVAIESIKAKRWDKVCKSVLEYYDKCYDFEKVGKNNIKILDLTDIDDEQITLKLIKNIL